MLISKCVDFYSRFTQIIKKCGPVEIGTGLVTLVTVAAFIHLAKASFSCPTPTLRSRSSLYTNLYTNSCPQTKSQVISTNSGVSKPLAVEESKALVKAFDTTKVDPTNIDCLPTEMLAQILLYVDHPTNTALVCRRWRDISNNLSTEFIKNSLLPQPWAVIFTPNISTIKVYKRAVTALIDELRELYYPGYLSEIRFSGEQKHAIVSVNFYRILRQKIIEANLLSFADSLPHASSSSRRSVKMDFMKTLDLFASPEDREEKHFRVGYPVTTLEELRMNWKHVTRLPKEIEYFKSLRILDLSENKLKTLTSSIGSLSYLQEIRVDRNQLEALPIEIGHLQNLKQLVLNNNRLKSLPKEIGDLKALEVLDIGNNQLTSLPVEIGGLKKLTKFALENNPIQALTPEILKLKALWRTVYFHTQRK